MTNAIQAFEKQIGYTFQDASLLTLALTHPSCDLEIGDNQRLEFLGDAVLDLIIAEALYEKNPGLDEGALDHMRASLVNGKALAARARDLDLGEFLQVSSAQRQHHPKPSSGMLEDAYEALIGAIHLDGGFDAAREFIHRIFGDSITTAQEIYSEGNPKGRLQEWTQQQHDGATPAYTGLSEEGPDHARIYTATVTINDKELGRGTGTSKKAAETNAAKNALKSLGT